MSKMVYSIDGVRGRHIDVYEDKVVISVKAGIGSFLTGNVSDGEKTIFYRDVIGVQFKKAGFQIGYLQIETASSQMNNRINNFFNENSFTFVENDKISNEGMQGIADYVKQRVDVIKSGQNSSSVTFSPADELRKFKDLLDSGVISQEEFDAKKKEILGM